jgi:hypothetical protein
MAREEVNAPPPGPSARCLRRVVASELGPSRLGDAVGMARARHRSRIRGPHGRAQQPAYGTLRNAARPLRRRAKVCAPSGRTVSRLVVPDDLAGALQLCVGGERAEHSMMVGWNRGPRLRPESGPANGFWLIGWRSCRVREVLESEHPRPPTACAGTVAPPRSRPRGATDSYRSGASPQTALIPRIELAHCGLSRHIVED